jgi:predicted PolB exonuclease-like 3'-5' exonuclease
MTLYLDIETVPKVNKFVDLDERGQDLFISKMRKDPALIAQFDSWEQLWQEQASFYAEFNRIICVSVGFVLARSGTMFPPEIKIKSFSADENHELYLLKDLSHSLHKVEYICAHYGKGFDFPMLARKYRMNGLDIPPILNTMGLKPWEVRHIDTQELWNFGSFKGSTSLDALAYCFGLPSPKKDMTGAQVREVFYEQEDLDKIVRYCEMDVKTLINVHRCITGSEPLDWKVEEVKAEIESKKP